MKHKKNYTTPGQPHFSHLERAKAERYIRMYGGKLVKGSSWSMLYNKQDFLIAYVQNDSTPQNNERVVINKEFVDKWRAMDYGVRKMTLVDLTPYQKYDLRTHITTEHIAEVPAGKRKDINKSLRMFGAGKETLWQDVSWYLHTGEVSYELMERLKYVRAVFAELTACYREPSYYSK